MKRSFVSAGFGVVFALSASLAQGQVIESFDSPNPQQGNGSNFAFSPPIQGSFAPGRGGVIAYNPTNITISNPSGGYGTAFKNIFILNAPPPGGSNGVTDISGSNALQLDVTLNTGAAGLFIDLVDGLGNAYQYFYGYGLVGDNTLNGPPQIAGETIVQGAAPNQLILTVPLATPFQDLNGTGMFDFSQITGFRIENDPGTSPSYSVSFNNLAGVTTVVPEPTMLAAGAGAGAITLFARRRQRA